MKRNLLLLLFRDVFVGISAAFGSASILQGFLLPRVPPLVILLLGIPAYVFCGAAYYLRYRKA